MSLEQENRICQMAASSGLDDFVVRRLWGREAISEPFRFDLELVAPDLEADLAQLLGTSVTFELLLASGNRRPFNGVVDHVRQLEADLTGAVYQVQLAPWTRLLELRTNCRIFQEMAVPDIIEAVLADHAAQDFVWRLEGDYQQRVLCVQYRESDWTFVARLLEEEGIAYHFEHEDGRHVLVFCDSPGQRQACPEQETVLFRTAQDAQGSDDGLLHDLVQEFRLERSLLSGRRLLTDFNYLDPGASLEAVAAAELAIAANRDLEDFEYPGGFVKLGAEDDAKLPFGETMAGLRAEALDARTLLAQGETTCRGFQAGFTFELENHRRLDCRIQWLLLAVVHNLDQSGSLSSSAGGEPHYAGAIVCLPATIPYRPPRLTPRPVVKGPQTAIVTGPSGEEIHTDKHGRIKVAFHWDRYGQRDGSDSCWVRVAHGWAGGGWGMQFTPRIGQEVVVDFLEGDPDRPLVVGSVYNGRNAIPYETPTQSGIRTHSSKEGTAANFNEIRFEDKKDEEQIFVQGEKNLDVRIKNDAFEWIGNNRHLVVKKDQLEHVEHNRDEIVDADHKEKIGKDRHLQIEGKEAKAVGGSLSLTVKGNVIEVFKADHSEQTTGDYYLKADNVVIEAMSNLTLKVGGSSIAIEAGGIGIKTGGQIKVECMAAMDVKATGPLSIQSSATTVKGDGAVTIQGGVVKIN